MEREWESIAQAGHTSTDTSIQFSDATPNTQSKYTNVTTQGNAVWDRKCRPVRRRPPV